MSEDVRLDDDMLEQWRWLDERGAPDDHPYVTRREIIDPQATQVRTLVVNWPFGSNHAHPTVILKKIKWGVLIAQILTAGLAGTTDWNSAIKQITDLFGAFDLALQRSAGPLEPSER
ncbi:hypothetical protein [Burkholderia cepacia]|uniref:hypothetical protein n=1 Tax=Burkholderia cepacia TaxID=292 RepID=UPI002FE351A9